MPQERLGNPVRIPDDTMIPADAIELKGFIENNVTYESHTFYLSINQSAGGRFLDSEIYMRNGAGLYRLGVRHMLARALKALVDAGDERSAFMACWEIFDQVRAAREHVWTWVKRAFLAGRLKKRRVAGGTRELARYTVWIEDEDGTMRYAA